MSTGRTTLAVVLAVAVAAACGSGSSGSPSASATGEGIVARLPDGWRRTVAYQPPQITDPVVRIAVASAPVTVAPRGCHVGAYRIPDDEAMIVVLEWRHRELQPRTPLPHPAEVSADDLTLRPKSVECFPGVGGAVQIADRGRVWGAYVMLGRRAPGRLRAEALDIIRSIRATGPPEPLPGLFDTTTDLAPSGGRLWRSTIRTVNGRGGARPAHRVEGFDPTTLQRAAPPVVVDAAWQLAGGPRRVWASGRGRIELIDSRTVRRAGTITGLDWALGGLAVGDGSAWVIESRRNRLRRIDARTGTLDPRWVRPARQPMSAIATFGSSILVTTLGRRLPRPEVSPTPRARGLIHRLDAGSGRVLERLLVGRGPAAVSVGFGSVWVLNAADGTVSRLSAAPLRRTATVRLGGGRAPTADLAAGAGFLWSVDGGGRLWAIEPASRRPTLIRAASAGPSQAVAVAAGLEGAFVALTGPERLCRLETSPPALGICVP